jgi:hypothetical protein
VVDARITAAQVGRECNRGADFSPKFRYEYSIGTERYSAERLSFTALPAHFDVWSDLAGRREYLSDAPATYFVGGRPALSEKTVPAS